MNDLITGILRTLRALLLVTPGPAFCMAADAQEPALREGSGRVVFVGDSITGQGGGWQGTGYVFKVGEALRAVHPGASPELVPLGGSGMGVGSWLGLIKDTARQNRELDVKGIEVAAALARTADVLVVMLGMNDVLAPYVNDSDESLDLWLRDYKELVERLCAKLQPRVTGLATITPQTEDPQTPKNKVMARMNQRIATLAGEINARLLPTQQAYWEALERGRRTQGDFSLAGDRIHPNATGHAAMAMGMLKGLGEKSAAAWLQTEKLGKTLAGLSSRPVPDAPPPWLVASGLVLKGWQEKPAQEDLLPNAIDLAIERGEPFWKTPLKAGGRGLEWRPFQSNLNLTDGASHGSVDFAGVTFGQNFEAGYGARWIKSGTARRLKLEMKASGVGSVIHLAVWLNGKTVYADMITREPGRKAVRDVELNAGWNVLAFKSCHRTWQWQQSVTLVEQDGSEPQGLEYRAEAP